MFYTNVPLSIFFTVSVSGILGLIALFWTWPGQILKGAAVATGLGIINSVGNLAGTIGPMITAFTKELMGNINNGTYVLGACLFLAGILVAFIPKSFDASARR